MFTARKAERPLKKLRQFESSLYQYQYHLVLIPLMRICWTAFLHACEGPRDCGSSSICSHSLLNQSPEHPWLQGLCCFLPSWWRWPLWCFALLPSCSVVSLHPLLPCEAARHGRQCQKLWNCRLPWPLHWRFPPLAGGPTLWPWWCPLPFWSSSTFSPRSAFMRNKWASELPKKGIEGDVSEHCKAYMSCCSFRNCTNWTRRRSWIKMIKQMRPHVLFGLSGTVTDPIMCYFG